MVRSLKNWSLGLALAVMTIASAHAQTGPDLSAVTDGFDDLSTALVTAAGLVITAGLALFAIRFGARWLKGLLKLISG